MMGRIRYPRMGVVWIGSTVMVGVAQKGSYGVAGAVAVGGDCHGPAEGAHGKGEDEGDTKHGLFA